MARGLRSPTTQEYCTAFERKPPSGVTVTYQRVLRRAFRSFGRLSLSIPVGRTVPCNVELGRTAGQGVCLLASAMFKQSTGANKEQALLRLAAQRLAQMRDRTDAQGQVVAKDISTLLAQRSVLLARAKAHKLIQDEILADMLEHLENLLGVLSERLPELDRCVL